MEINNPHDGLFSFTFNDKLSVIQFGQKFFPTAIGKQLDFDSFQKEDTSYVTEELRPFYSDKVWSCLWQGTQKRVKVSFLFEHKSYLENPWLQLHRYLVEGYRNQTQQQKAVNKKNKTKTPIRLTPIIPVLFYHGTGKWNYHSFEDQFDLPAPLLKAYLPSFDYILVDLSKYSDSELLAMETGFLVSTLLLLKHKNDKEFIKQYRQEIFIFVEVLKYHPSTDSFLEALILYIFRTNKFEPMEVNELIEKLPNKAKKVTMSTYDMLIAKGEARGEVKGEAKGEIKGQVKGKFKSTIEFALSLIIGLPQLTNKQIAEFSSVTEPIVQAIRAGFKAKKISKVNQVVLKAFQEITPLKKEDKTDMKKLIKKYYLLFTKKKK